MMVQARGVRTIAAMAIVGLMTSVASAQQPWSLDGSAEAVKAGNGPNPWAISLLSLEGYVWPEPEAGGAVVFTPRGGTTFADLWELSTDYKADFLGGGSPRFSVGVDLDGDVKYIHIHIGDLPNFVGGPTDWENTGNLIEAEDARFDTAQVGGTFYDDYLGALLLAGDAEVVEVLVVADAGWLGDQEVLVDNVQVNNFKLNAKGVSKKK